MDTTIQGIEALLNRVLAMDAESRVALARLQGRTLAVCLNETRLEVYMTVMAEGVSLSTAAPEQVDVTVRGTPIQFLTFLRNAGSTGTGAAGTIEIAGDVALAQELQTIIRNMDPDWEESLSALVGDTLARKLGRLVRSSGEYLANTGRTLEADISEYLRYEKDLLPDRFEVEEFHTEVETLRYDVDRLQARIDRLLDRVKS